MNTSEANFVINQKLKSDTHKFALFLAAFGAIQVALPGMSEILGPYYPTIVMIIGVIVAVLREKTNCAVNDK